MFGKELFEELFTTPALAGFHRLKTSSNALDGFHPFFSIEQFLVAFHVLHHNSCFAIDGKNNGFFGSFQLPQQSRSISLERTQAFDVSSQFH